MSPTPPYPNDTLRWVAAEVRYPPVDELATGVPPELRSRLRDEFPILEPQTQFSISLGPGGPQPQPSLMHRLLRRDRLMSVTVSRDAVTLETTDYEGWTTFIERFSGILANLENICNPAGVLRVGLRYIDEVRLPNPPTSIAEWEGWIDDRLLSPFSLNAGRALSNGTIALQFGDAPGYVIIYRAAPFSSGRAVQLEGPLRMPISTPDGPYFLLDADASWVDPERNIPEFTSTAIRDIFSELHRPCKDLYESSITDRLRTDILNKDRREVWGQ